MAVLALVSPTWIVLALPATVRVTKLTDCCRWYALTEMESTAVADFPASAPSDGPLLPHADAARASTGIRPAKVSTTRCLPKRRRPLLLQVLPPHCGVAVEVVVLPALPESPVVRVVDVDRRRRGSGGRRGRCPRCSRCRGRRSGRCRRSVPVAASSSTSGNRGDGCRSCRRSPPRRLPWPSWCRCGCCGRGGRPAGGVRRDTGRPSSKLSTELSLPSIPIAQTPIPSKPDRAASWTFPSRVLALSKKT